MKYNTLLAALCLVLTKENFSFRVFDLETFFNKMFWSAPDIVKDVQFTAKMFKREVWRKMDGRSLGFSDPNCD